MLSSSLHVRSLAKFFLRRRLGPEQVVVWAGLGLVVAYMSFLSPWFSNEAKARMLFFDALPWVLFPFLFAEHDFDQRGWLRLFLTSRADRRTLFLAHAFARIAHALVNALVISVLLVFVARDVHEPGTVLLRFLGITGFALFVAALGSAVGLYAQGRIGIVANYIVLFTLGYLAVKAPSGLSLVANYAVFPAALAGIESSRLWLTDAPWRALAGVTASLLWWAIAYRVFLRRSAA